MCPAKPYKGSDLSPLQPCREWPQNPGKPKANRSGGIGGEAPMAGGFGGRPPCPLQGGLRGAICHPLQTRHEWDRIHWQTQSKRGWGEIFMPIEIVLFGPLARGWPSPTFVKPGVEGTQSPTRGFKRGRVAIHCKRATSGTEYTGKHKANGGGGKFSCRLKSSFLGLWPEVGLRRP